MRTGEGEINAAAEESSALQRSNQRSGFLMVLLMLVLSFFVFVESDNRAEVILRRLPHRSSLRFWIFLDATLVIDLRKRSVGTRRHE